MSDQNQSAGITVTVPEDVRLKFPELVPQILASPSMDDNERNYWFGVLPIMTPEQVAELRDILKTEQDRIAAAKAKEAATVEIDPEKIEAARRITMKQRELEEQKLREMDADNAEDLLGQLEEL